MSKKIKFLLMLFALVITSVFLSVKTNLINLSHADTDYSIVSLTTLDSIKNNSAALSQVKEINITSEDGSANTVSGKLNLISLCPNVEIIIIDVEDLSLNKNFFNSLNTSSEGIRLTVIHGNSDFSGVNNPKITYLMVMAGTTSNLSAAKGFSNLSQLVLAITNGVDSYDFSEFSKLKHVQFYGMNVPNYNVFLNSIKNVVTLTLSDCNIRDVDTHFLTDLDNLRYLHLDGSYITDISFARQIEKLQVFELPYDVSDVSVLYDLPNLKKVSFDSLTETRIDNNLVNYFNTKGITYPANFDRNMGQKLQNIINSFNFTSSTTELQKIRTITEYVVNNMEYISSEYQNITKLDHAINDKYGVCDEYSILEYTLLKLAGIDAYRVVGTAYQKPETGRDRPGNHAWNMVKVNGSWYGIDPTWIYADQYTGWNLFYMKNTKNQNLNVYNQDNMFANLHETVNNPMDTIDRITTVTGITVKTMPTKTSYVQNVESLDLTGGVLSVSYDDGTTTTVSLTDSSVTVTGFSNSTVGTKTISVSYKGKGTTFNVTVVPKQVNSISVTTNPTKTKYIQNFESLDLTGGVLTVNYNDNTHDTMSLANNSLTVSGFDNSKVGTNTITISYGGVSTTFNVSIVAKSLVSIAITKEPTKKEYIQGYESLDLTGGVLTATYNDNSSGPMNLTNPSVSVSGFDNSTLGAKTITVSLEGKTATFTVTIVEKQIAGISVSTAPLKKQYVLNTESLDLTGGVISVNYNNATSDTVSLTNEQVKVTGFDNTKLGTNTITVEYLGYKSTFTVDIIELASKPEPVITIKPTPTPVPEESVKPAYDANEISTATVDTAASKNDVNIIDTGVGISVTTISALLGGCFFFIKRKNILSNLR